MSLFVFTTYIDHRDLHVLTHSFPTRRSSDRPDNNHVEWSTSLRPNEQPAAIDVRNESRSENRRILFQMVDGRTYRLAATLFVKSGSQAVIRLPIGAYRIDVASSPTEMPWEEAKAVIPIPRFALQLGEADNEPSPRNRIFIDEEGKVRPSIKPSKPSPVAEKRSKRQIGRAHV